MDMHWEEGRRVRISEVQLFTARPMAIPPETYELVSVLDARGVRSVYADRDLANAVQWWWSGKVRSPVDTAVSAASLLADGNAMRLTPDTVIVVPPADAPLCRRSFAAREIAMRETLGKGWVAFDFPPGGWRPRYRVESGLYWAGFGCLADRRRAWAAALLPDARALYAEGRRDDAIRLARRAVGETGSEQARTQLAEWTKKE